MSAPPPPGPPPGFQPPEGYPVNLPPILPANWSEHLAPDGRPYYHNVLTNVTTYDKPSLQPPAGSKIDPITGELIIPQAAPAPKSAKKKKKEKPKTKTPIEGTEWIKVVTTEDNVFYMNSVSKTSVWTVPEKVKVVLAAQRQAEEEAEVERVKQEAEAESKKRAAEDEAEPVKPKKKKPKTVHSLADIADDDLKKEIADKVAHEAERLDAEELATLQSQPSEAPVPVAQMTSDEMKASFLAMLSEKDINPMAPWDAQLPKFVSDPRYGQIKLLKERRELFDTFCKDKIREQRAKKASGQEAKLDPEQGYRALLVAEVTSTRAHWDDFKLKFKKDNRFRSFGRDDREREKAFKSWLRELGEIKRADAKKAEEKFSQLLHESQISADTTWPRVKASISNDPRYEAVRSSSQREDLFKKYLASLAEQTEEPSVDKAQQKKDRALASLKEREAQVAAQRAAQERVNDKSKMSASRDEAEREFKSLLVDAVRDPNVSWDEVAPGLSNDPRFNLPGLTPQFRLHLFRTHIDQLSSKRLGSLEAVFAIHTPRLDASFDQVLPKLKEDALVQRHGYSDGKLEDLYTTWQRKAKLQARDDLLAMLKENAYVEFWGRLSKEASEKRVAEGIPEDEETAEADQVDLKSMSQKFDLKQASAVLKNDKRYQDMSYDPETRDHWIRQYLQELSAPSMTVHQKE